QPRGGDTADQPARTPFVAAGVSPRASGAATHIHVPGARAAASPRRRARATTGRVVGRCGRRPIPARADGDGASPTPVATGCRLSGGGMSTQAISDGGSRIRTVPQRVVAVTPALPHRRNAELLLLGFAAVITTVALIIVAVNQEQVIRWDLAQYSVAY